MTHKSGFVNIIGSPNVGKSTLMNELVGEKLSIITSKAQTTRHRIMGIVNGDDFQIVYSDTPGILDPAYKLQESMMKFVETAFQDADVFLLVTEIGEKFKHESVLKKLQTSTQPVIVAINKIDLSTQEIAVEQMEIWKQLLPNASIVPISALNKFNTESLLEIIKEKLPESPPYFPKDELTDKPQRFFISEILREKIFLNYKKEIPYSSEVEIESYVEEETIIKIRAIIYVERDSQKGIIIGHLGKALKKTATEARKDIEAFLEKQVFIEVFVKVSKDWRSKETSLRKFGYFNF
jgi:GTP-binding protein Era